ncbi:hypothetical protein AURDEDRAFT_167676 [Auricularia subglabra TFB-10046 SS5]|nr:hypothetical protein AURDEDRAFT_167676 [Auricularia subglabra TFB-10046 SS5]
MDLARPLGDNRPSLSTDDSSELRAEEERPPVPGEIWWAFCSVTKAVLEAAQAYSSVPPSEAMRTDLEHYKDDESKLRPVVVTNISEDLGTADVIPLATFSGKPIQRLPKHFQRLSVSVGVTTPWPQPTSACIYPTPSWPKSREKPCYAVAHTVQVARSNVIARYTWTSWAGPGQQQVDSFLLGPGEMRKMGRIIQGRIASYDHASHAELHDLNNSWTPKIRLVENLRRARLQWDGRNGRAAVPTIPEMRAEVPTFNGSQESAAGVPILYRAPSADESGEKVCFLVDYLRHLTHMHATQGR